MGHDERTFIDWIVETLDDGGLTVGDSVAPSTADDATGYVVVYSVAGGEVGGSVDAPRSDTAPNVQITSSSTSPQQARWLAMKARTLLEAAVPATVGDRQVIWIDFATASVTVARDDRLQPPRYFAPDRLEFGTVDT